MKTRSFLLACLLFNLVFITEAQTYCEFIHKVREYQASVKLNEHVEDKYPIPEVDTASFDINAYMSFFDKLKLKAGLNMFLVNYYSSDAGRPALCVHDTAFNMDMYVDKVIIEFHQYIDSLIDQRKTRFQNENYQEDKINKLERIRENQKKAFTRNSALIRYATDSTKLVCNNLIPEDSPEGYLQYLFFSQMGDQFALYWHSFGSEKTVICDSLDVEFYISYYANRNSYFEYSEKEMKQLLHTDLCPVIELDSTECKITWYEIHTHKGIFRKAYSIERNYPFRVRTINVETITTISANFFY